ncbi:MAG: peptidoglycan-associated lipoprotein Pal [Deltaproteobacteria bacterium]|nr:peptidoglycan-associated lipoprotein Pal [Deltaproteobacteria bacterium]MBW2070103.1 peptidoglycan-associated lipoprotein Pal [Deltaproteobacteria bacterium]
MGKRTTWIVGSIFLIVLLVFAVSCQKRVVGVGPEPGEQVSAEEQAKAQQEAAEAAARQQALLEAQRLREQQAKEAEAAKESEAAKRRAFEEQDIHFDFDQYVLKPAAIQILDEKAAYMREHPDVRVLIEGHCDERGSNEYNLALGDRRANSAKNYLVRAGIAEKRIVTISYGEERPLCTQHTESCWWKNRRAHFVIR